MTSAMHRPPKSTCSTVCPPTDHSCVDPAVKNKIHDPSLESGQYTCTGTGVRTSSAVVRAKGAIDIRAAREKAEIGFDPWIGTRSREEKVDAPATATRANPHGTSVTGLDHPPAMEME